LTHLHLNLNGPLQIPYGGVSCEEVHPGLIRALVDLAELDGGKPPDEDKRRKYVFPTGWRGKHQQSLIRSRCPVWPMVTTEFFKIMQADYL